MSLRRHCKSLSVLILGVWLFALFVGVANACATTATPASASQGMAMPHNDGQDEQSANCLQFCSDDTPVFSKLQLVPDRPTSQPLLVTISTSSHVSFSTPAAPVVYLAGPPPRVPALLRFQRLAL